MRTKLLAAAVLAGLTMGVEPAPTAFTLPDSDGDGVADVYELLGYSAGGATIDFPALGADPFRRDIFVEADIMSGVTVPAGAFDDMIAAFRLAPLVNRDYSTGVNLVIDASQTVPFSTQITFQDGLEIDDDFRNPSIDVAPTGAAIVAWQDDRDGNAHWEIYSRRFDAAGNPTSAETVVNDSSAGDQITPDAATHSGRTVVVWADDKDGNGYYQIYASFIGPDIVVNAVSDGQQSEPAVDMDASGSWIAVWRDDRDGNGSGQIYARRYNRATNALGPEVVVNPVAAGEQRLPDIAMASDGRAVVVWEDDRDGNGYYEIYGRLLDATGQPNGPEFRINVESAGQQRAPAVGMDDGGAFVAVWEDDQDGNGYYEILARAFSGTASPQGTVLTANAVSDGQQRRPAVSKGTAGEFAVAWQDDQDGNGVYELLMRTFDRAGTALSGNRTVNASSAGEQQNATVGMATDGTASVAYQDDRDRNGDWSIFMRRFDRLATPVSADAEVHDHPVTFGRLKDRHFTDVRRGFFHYLVVANAYIRSGVEGIAEVGGDDLLITLGRSPTRINSAATTMHELGHNLGLLHGGNEDQNRKPNYMSVMNYRYSSGGVDRDCDAFSSEFSPELLDYSQGRRRPLDEDRLDERVGICLGDIDVNSISSGQQRDPDVAVDGAGRMAIVWEDDRDGNGVNEILLRRYDAAGVPSSQDLTVNPVSAGEQRDPVVALAADGSGVVVWADDRDDNGSYQIKAQRIALDGSRVGSEISVNVEAAGQQLRPDAAMADDGTFVVVWEDDRDGNQYYEIYARRFGPTGTALSGDVLVNASSDGQQLRPRVAMAATRQFVVVWQDDGDGNGKYEVLGRRFSSGGVAQGGNIAINSVSAGNQLAPDVAIDATGRFVAVWADDQNENGIYQIRARRFTAAGVGMAADFTVNQVSTGQQVAPRVHANSTFRFAVVWQDDRNENGVYEVMVRPFQSNGVGLAERTLPPVSAGQQEIPVIGMDGAGNVYVAWQDDRDGNGYDEIWAARGTPTAARRDTRAIDWDADGNNTEIAVAVDINRDERRRILNDVNDWGRIRLNF